MTAPAPSTCPECGGEGQVLYSPDPDAPMETFTRPCTACSCVNCGQPCLTGLCPACDAADLYERDLTRERGR